MSILHYSCEVWGFYTAENRDWLINVKMSPNNLSLFIRFTARAFRKLLSIYVFSYFPFGFEGRMWDLIASIPDHCLSFYFSFLSVCRQRTKWSVSSRMQVLNVFYVSLCKQSEKNEHFVVFLFSRLRRKFAQLYQYCASINPVDFNLSFLSNRRFLLKPCRFPQKILTEDKV